MRTKMTTRYAGSNAEIKIFDRPIPCTADERYSWQVWLKSNGFTWNMHTGRFEHEDGRTARKTIDDVHRTQITIYSPVTLTLSY